MTNQDAKARHATMTHDPDRAPPGRGAERREANGAAKPDTAAERRAAQLRENLRRRKRQQRLRDADPD